MVRHVHPMYSHIALYDCKKLINRETIDLTDTRIINRETIDLTGRTKFCLFPVVL